MTREQLKEKLLKTKCYVDNEYLDKYVDLIIRNRDTKKSSNTQRHHILQRSYFKLNEKTLDDSAENVVNLLFKDHILAHYYLAMCSQGKLKAGNAKAVYMMTQRKKLPKSDKELLEQLPYYQEIYELGDNKTWKDWQIELLTKFYQEVNKDGIRKHVINFQPLIEKLQNKSLSQIKNEAAWLGLTMKKFQWTAEKDVMVKELFPAQGRKCAKAIGCSEDAVVARAAYLNVKYNNDEFWTTSEDKLLGEIYPKGNKEKILAAFPNRTWSSIQSRASLLGISKYSRGYSEYQTTLIIKEYSKLGGKGLIEKYPEVFAGKSRDTIMHYAGYKLGLKYGGNE